LIEGRYRLQTTYGGNAVEREFSISGGGSTVLSFDGAQSPIGPGVARIAPAAPTRAVEPVTEIVKRFCTNCGAQLKADARFCEKCGAKATN
jgi:ribosomal protein L40E